ncbi:10481_t:CDS:2, partial [Funneliformis geosporum]
RDGNTPAAFHQKCDNNGANIVVIKINGTEQIVGGYNPFGWEGNGHKTTKDSFIFSFVNRTNLQTAKDDSRFPDVRPKIESIRTLTTVTVYYYAFDIKDVRRSSSSYANILYKLPTLLREFK